MSVLRGGSITFKAKVLGIPPPDIQWLLDNKKVTENATKTEQRESIHTYTFTDCKLTDKLVAVRAWNGVGEHTESTTIFVPGKLTYFKIII